MILAPDLSQFSLFFSSIARSIATCNGCGYVGNFEDDLNRLFPSSPRLTTPSLSRASSTQIPMSNKA